jgi:hypothetical protein
MPNRVYLWVLILLFPILVQSQNFNPEIALKQYASNPGEKVYVSFDKTEYVSGETIQYKAIVLSGLQVSDISSNLYIELMDPGKSVVYRNMIPLINGFSFGSFVIPKHLNENVYYFRAYTRWMLNWDDRLNLIEPIKIFNSSSDYKIATSPVQYKPEVFVESKNLIDSLPANVVIRLKPEGNLPLKWNGYLFDRSKEEEHLVSFENYNQQFSSFRFIPFAGKQYAVKIMDDSGKTSIINLPEVHLSGINFQVLNLDSAVLFNLVNNKSSLKGYRILAQTNGTLIYNGSIAPEYNNFSGKIKMDSFCVGIIHFSIFDPEGNSILERMVFPNISKIGIRKPVIVSKKISNQPRISNKVDMVLDNSNGGNFLAQVVNNIVPVRNHDWNLLCAIYFGDLISRPYNATWYFSNSSKNLSLALDALMISEKWSRFRWTDFSDKNRKHSFYTPDNFLSFTGKISRNQKMLANREMTVWIQQKDSSRSFIKIKTDSVGSFDIDGLHFYDKAMIFIMDNESNTFPYDIEVQMRKNASFRSYIGELPESYYVINKKNGSYSPSPAVQYYTDQVKLKDRESNRIDMIKAFALKSRKYEDFFKPEEETPAATITGYEVAKIDYQFENQKNSMFSKDKRSVLYWNPWISNGPGNFSFEFVNSEIPGVNRLIVTGFNKEGQPVLLETNL